MPNFFPFISTTITPFSCAAKMVKSLATGIDSRIVGETDIFGQVKKSLKNSQKHNFVNSELGDVFAKAIHLSKDIRTETNLSKNPLSIASLVESEIQKNNLKEVMVIGAGEVGKTLIKRLVERAKNSGRADDTEEVIVNRQNVYLELTAPLIEFYQSNIIHVDGDGSIDKVTERILKRIP